MKRHELLEKYELRKLDNNTVFINNQHVSFSYTNANHIVKEEYKDQYRYFGGLQCNYRKGTPEYKNIEQWLCELAEQALK